MLPIPYCLNIHPGESLTALYRAIETHALGVKKRLAPHTPYPLGLRLAATAASALHEIPTALQEFSDFLAAHALYTTCINGFPYGAFHGQSVKQAVYQPAWCSETRLKYTAQLAQILAHLLPADATGNISTLPLGYAFDDQGTRWSAAQLAPRHKLYARQLALMAEFLAQQHAATGRAVLLALEPEPDCLLENVQDTIIWFEEHLLYEGIAWLSAGGRRTRADAEMLLRQYITICFDTCHFATNFEDPLSALYRLESAGIRIARIQLSAALSTTLTPAAIEALAAFIDPVYLHQTRIQLPRGTLLSLPDLTRASLSQARQHLGQELRTHFHVPLFWQGDATLHSTNRELTPAFFAHVQQQGYPLETETYTFDVLPPALRTADVVASLVQEHQWVQTQLTAVTGTTPAIA